MRLTRETAASDSGMTLIELIVAMSLLLVALAMFSSALYVTQRSAQQSSKYSLANDAVHLALQDIDRQLRSGYLVSVDGIGTAAPAGRVARIYTEVNGVGRCVAWAVAAAPLPEPSYALYTVSWPGEKTFASAGIPTSFNSAPWRMVTDGLAIAKLNLNGSTAATLSAPFVKKDSVVATGSGVKPPETLDITLWLLTSPRESSADYRYVEVSSSFTSRNVMRSTEKVTGSTSTKYLACG